MGLGDVRFTVLEVVQEVFRKLGLTQPTSLTANKLSIQMVDYVNDICDDLSDFGNWQEMMVSANVSAVNGQRDYVINTSANVKNIADIYYSTRTGPVSLINIETMRRMVSANGTPTQYTIFGTDASTANPVLRFRPTPVSGNGGGGYFSVLYFVRAPSYTTSDASTVIPFPGQLVTLGVLAKAYLIESQGAPTDIYKTTYNDYLQARKEAYNRFKGDTGWNISFVPSRQTRRR
jgi:hypothetical protein